MKKRADSVEMVRGMAVAEAAASNKNGAVRSEIRDDDDEARLKLRLFVGEQSTLVTLDNFDVDHVLEDTGARSRIEGKIRSALTGL
jgi:hypothetical protein